MSDGIRTAIEGAIGYLTDHPDEARYTDSPATARIEEGLRVRVEGPEGAAVVTDMVEAVGGANSAPGPGWLYRAALASCVATLAAMRGAQVGVEMSGLEVVVDSESDDRGILGIDPDVPAGPLSVSVRATGVDGDEARDVLEWAMRHCPVADATGRAVPITLELA